MANPDRGEVEVKLGGKMRTMRPTFQGLREVEHRTGLGVIELVQRFGEGKASLDHVAIVLAIGLRAANDDAPDYDQIGEMLMRQGMSDVLLPILVFLASAFVGDQAKNLLAPQGKGAKASPGGA
jgi:hypothetical protein